MTDEPEPRNWAQRTREAAVRMDSDGRLLKAAQRLRRRLPGDDRFGDPLSLAGDEPVQRIGRGVGALQPDRPSLLHELGLGGLQVWQSLSEATGRGRGDQPLAILFTDLVGFSKWALDAGDEAALDLLRAVGVVLEDAVLEHDGRIVKRLGDGLMAVFREPEWAVEAALDAMAGLTEVEVAGHRPSMRAGIHYGRPRRLGGDYLGVDVNVAARVADAAKGEQLLVSEDVFERLDAERYKAGRAKVLRAQGAPKGLRVRTVGRP